MPGLYRVAPLAASLSRKSSCPSTSSSAVRNTVATSSGKPARSEEHTSELQSLMRISYAVFCLKKKKKQQKIKNKYYNRIVKPNRRTKMTINTTPHIDHITQLHINN